jgi:hypothetical protein
MPLSAARHDGDMVEGILSSLRYCVGMFRITGQLQEAHDGASTVASPSQEEHQSWEVISVSEQ